MVRKVLEHCPSCGGQLEIAEVHCTACETQVRARYRPCDFCALTVEQSTFLRMFVMSRGNLSEVEKRLGVSYPTVRAKLDEVIERLSGHVPQSQSAPPAGNPKGRGAPPHPVEARAGVVAVAPPPSPDPNAGEGGERRRILEAVARGEIDAAEGLRRMRTQGERHEED